MSGKWPAALALALAMTPPALAAPEGFLVVLERAEFVLSEAARPPGDDAPWVDMRLPHRWGETHPGVLGRGWYRIRIDLPQAPQRTQAVALSHWRSQWVDFWVNGTLIGSSRDVVAGGIGLGTPLFLTIPPRLLHEGPNEIHARLYASDPIQGLGRVYFGDGRPVRKVSLAHQELNFYAQRAFLAMVLAGGLISLFVWFARRTDRVMLWFSVVTLSWALAGVVWNAQRWLDIPFANSVLIGYIMYGLPVPAVILALRTADLRWPKLEAALWAFLVFVIGIRVLLPTTGLSLRAAIIDCVNAALLVTGAVLILRAPAGNLRWSHRVEAAALVAMALLLLYEVMRYVGWVDVERAVLRPYHVPVMLLAIGAAIFERHLFAVRQAERTNVELQRLVDEKAREIEAFHAEREAVLRQQALAQERQRILADMHDGVGASLVGLLHYAQGGQIDARTVEQRVREAMQELRIAIDALDPAEGDVATVLGKLRYRLEPLLAATRTHLSWDVAELPRVEGLDPSAVLAIQRIVLEAVSNALKHAGARNIRLAARPRDGPLGIEIRIEDDGAGYDPDRPGGGRGLGTMRERAHALGGSVEVRSRAGAGTTVTLVIPVTQPAAPQHSKPGSPRLLRA